MTKIHIDFHDETYPGWACLYIDKVLVYENDVHDLLGFVQAIAGSENVSYRENVSEEDDYPNFEEEEAVAKLRASTAKMYEQPLTSEQKEELKGWERLQTKAFDELWDQQIQVGEVYQSGDWDIHTNKDCNNDH